MSLSTGTSLLALGAILRFVVTVDIRGVALDVVGTILMLAGAVLLIGGAIAMSTARGSTTEVYERRSPDGHRVVRQRVDI